MSAGKRPHRYVKMIEALKALILSFNPAIFDIAAKLTENQLGFIALFTALVNNGLDLLVEIYWFFISSEKAPSDNIHHLHTLAMALNLVCVAFEVLVICCLLFSRGYITFSFWQILAFRSVSIVSSAHGLRASKDHQITATEFRNAWLILMFFIFLVAANKILLYINPHIH